jgi:hypothetical protein
VNAPSIEVEHPAMSQIQGRQTDPERGDNIQAVTGTSSISTPCLRGFTAFKGDGHDLHKQPWPASDLPLWPQQGDSNFGDSSGPIFSMYSKLSKEEDDALVDRWQKDADGILIFVSPSVDIHTNAHTNYNILDWSVLCCGRYIAFPVSRGSQAEFSRYFHILSWQYISDSR